MINFIFRAVIVSAILGAGILLLYFISYAGVKISAPTENLIASISNTIKAVETSYIMTKRGHSRNSDLNWLNDYRKSPTNLTAPQHFLLGAYDNEAFKSLRPIVNLEDSLGTVFPIIHIYTAWGNKREQKFPAAEVNNIRVLGSIPLITWEPWLVDFDKQGKKNPEEISLKSITSGKFDSYIDNWAAEAKAYKQPIFLRFGHEMNDPFRYPWGPPVNEPDDFKSSWTHVVDRFRAVGADNVIWVWSPHPAYGNFQAYYPGDEYVDWIGSSALNYGKVASWSDWWSFSEIFDQPYFELSKYDKPIMIAEFGSVAVGGNRAEWFRDALTDFPSNYPLVKALVFFHNSRDATNTAQPLDWYFHSDAHAIKAIGTAIENWGTDEVSFKDINRMVTARN